MKKTMSVRKQFRKKRVRSGKVKKEQLRSLRRLEKTDFLQWSANTINGVKQ